MNICKSLVFMGLDLNIKKRQGGILSTPMLSSILCPQSPKGTECYIHFSLKIIITIYIYKKKKKKKNYSTDLSPKTLPDSSHQKALLQSVNT